MNVSKEVLEKNLAALKMAYQEIRECQHDMKLSAIEDAMEISIRDTLKSMVGIFNKAVRNYPDIPEKNVEFNRDFGFRSWIMERDKTTFMDSYKYNVEDGCALFYDDYITTIRDRFMHLARVFDRLPEDLAVVSLMKDTFIPTIRQILSEDKVNLNKENDRYRLFSIASIFFPKQFILADNTIDTKLAIMESIQKEMAAYKINHLTVEDLMPQCRVAPASCEPGGPEMTP